MRLSICGQANTLTTGNNMYTPEMVGSGQFGICAKCGLPPTPEGHDGCLGTLNEKVVMNACCGHGLNRQAYVQFWDESVVRGEKALRVIDALKQEENQCVKN